MLILSLIYLTIQDPPPKPTIPNKYRITGLWRIPYWTADINEQIIVNYDKTGNKERIDYYNGLEIDWMTSDNYNYHDHVEINKRVCWSYHNSKRNFIEFFPNLDNYTYKGDSVIRGKKVNVWEQTIKQEEKTMIYNFYVDFFDNETPIQYSLRGFNVIYGSHIDEYFLDYLTYQPNYNDPNAFILPERCSKKSSLGPKYISTKDFLSHSIENMLIHGENIGKSFENFKKNMEIINNHNNPNYKLSPNRFLHLSPSDLKKTKRTTIFPKNIDIVQYEYQGIDLPKEFSWIDYNAVSPVKDQVACGSCWAFSTTGSFESANYFKTGQMILLSEQQLVDCSWNKKYDNDGCDGGLQWNAMSYIKDYGLISQNTYGRYLGKDGYCGYNEKIPQIQLSYAFNVSNDANTVKEALYLNGPLTISTDVTEKFEFYSSGVLDDPECGNTENDLVHGVLLVGWGNLNDKEFWLVKNSWSTHWGDQGYIRIAIKGNICGITTQVMAPVISRGITK